MSVVENIMFLFSCPAPPRKSLARSEISHAIPGPLCQGKWRDTAKEGVLTSARVALSAFNI